MTTTPAPPTHPDPDDVQTVRGLLDLMVNFESNDQRARYLLSSNWLRDRGAEAANLAATTPLAEIERGESR